MTDIVAMLLLAGVALRTAPVAAPTMAIPSVAPTVDASADVPANASVPTPISTDRPTKADAVCTVPQGGIPIEADAINRTHFASGGVDTDMILYTNPTIKYGLGTTTDIGVDIAPCETVRVRGQGASDTLGGVGDPDIRLTQRLTAPGAKTQIAFIPYGKAPIVRFGIGNKRWEGGLILPVIFTPPSGVTLNFGPEIDFLADGDRHGHHADIVGLANLSHAIGNKGTVYAEYRSSRNIDPAGAIHQYPAVVAYAYLMSSRLQIDCGGNSGLNYLTPAIQTHPGVSTRL